MPGRPEEHVVLVQPQDGGWTVDDDREDEPIWFGAFEEALGEALACGALALETRLLGELRDHGPRPAPPDGRLAAGPEPHQPSGLP